jgi:ABC-type transport system substrate-binding protein
MKTRNTRRIKRSTAFAIGVGAAGLALAATAAFAGVHIAASRAAAAATSVPPPLSGPGEVIVALPSGAVPAEIGLNRAGTADSVHYYGIGETLFLLDSQTEQTLPWLATGWALDTDLGGATLTIQQGVPFQSKYGSFGDVTAADVAWSMNDANARVTPSSVHSQAGAFSALFEEWTVMDDSTAHFNFASYDSTWKDDFLNQFGRSFTVLSRTACDQNGSAWCQSHLVSTGPFTPSDWLPGNRLVLESDHGHWKFNPPADRITLLEVPDPLVRDAMMKIGDAGAAVIDVADARRLIRRGFERAPYESAVQLGVFFAGNLWETHHAGNGSPLERSTYTGGDLAWIGNPDQAGDMEQARLIRHALAMAIDRQSINQDLVKGLGEPVHVTYVSTGNPRWRTEWEYASTPPLPAT